MILRSKDFYIYLTLIFILNYVGSFSIMPFVEVQYSVLFNKPVFYVLLLLNSFMVFKISEKSSESLLISLIISTLYIASPYHLDLFYLPFEGQFLLAEFFLLISYILYKEGRINYSILTFLFSMILNFKFIGLLPLIFSSKKIETHFKYTLAGVATTILIYLVPGFVRNRPYFLDHLKAIIYQIENLLVPFNSSIFTNAILIKDYYSVCFFILIALALLSGFYYCFRKKIENYQFIISLLIGAFIGAFIPVKFFGNYRTHFYYFTPSLTPNILLAFLLLVLYVLKKYRSKLVLSSFVMLAISWAITSQSSQSIVQNQSTAWAISFGKLPAHFYYEEFVKYNYAKILIQASKFKEAEDLIIQSKINFKTERWFNLHMQIAVGKKDAYLLSKIKEELVNLKIPIDYRDNSDVLP